MIILSVDYGDIRTGIAVCDKFEMMASPVTVITQPNRGILITEITRIAAQKQAELIIVGLPRNMDGTSGSRAQASAEFAEKLEAAAGIPVKLWDERLTTIAANTLLNETGNRGKKRKKIIDAVAAAMILQDYIDYKKNTLEHNKPTV